MTFKKTALSITVVLLALVIGSTPALAGGKPADVIAKSNGFPSGMHFNLNIHGADLSEDDPCVHEPGGNSVFINLYGDSVIEYQSGRKISGTELVVIDPCASGDGKVSVQIPSKVLVYDEDTMTYNEVAVAGYRVFGRILAKPQNGKNDPDDLGRSNIIFSPNVVTDAYNTIGEGEELVELGLILWNGTYYAGTDAYYRFQDPDGPAKGKSKANDMTPLFTFSGWVVDSSLDTDLDGAITVADIPAIDFGSGVLGDADLDGDVDVDDIGAWLAILDADPDPAIADLVTMYENEWIFNIADFVTTEGDVTNDGTKLFQARFYPYFD